MALQSLGDKCVLKFTAILAKYVCGELNLIVKLKLIVRIVKMDDPKKCQFQLASCGNCRSRRDATGCFVLKDLRDNCSSLFNVDDNTIIRECDLISMRSPVPLNHDGLICGQHRFTLGKDYYVSPKCKYSQHPATSQCKGGKISWKLYKFVKTRDSTFVIGSLICKICQAQLNALKLEQQIKLEENVESSTFAITSSRK